jgi:putative membrane protein
MTYYVLKALATGPGLIVMLPYLFVRYHTMRYRFDDEGISMSWGILFRREVHLTYSRIQDIHLRSNLVERWLGLARIQVQTASGSADAELTIEGLLEYQAVRDFIYAKMRGLREAHEPAATSATTGAVAGPDALAEALREVAAELRGLREALSRGERGGPADV